MGSNHPKEMKLVSLKKVQGLDMKNKKIVALSAGIILDFFFRNHNKTE